MKERSYEIAISHKYDGYQNKKTESGANVNGFLAQKLQISKKGKVYARFKDNTWVADLAEIRSLSSFNRSIKYSLCVYVFYVRMNIYFAIKNN